MTKTIHVEAFFGEDGKIRPSAFVWDGRRFPILSLGRQWQEGWVRRFLVMTAGEQVFEISFNEDDGSWSMGRSPGEFSRNWTKA